MIENVNYDYRIYYMEPYYSSNNKWNYGDIINENYIQNSESISSYISDYNSDKNILVQPFRFIVEDEIRESDKFIVFEPPGNITNKWTILIKNIIVFPKYNIISS